ncbi:hypothetical protein KCV01_g13671, partial [Aureobasidium melanogenum]
MAVKHFSPHYWMYLGDGGARYVQTSLVSDITRFNRKSIELAPCIYQEYVEKAFELRVTVIGERIFAAKIEDGAGGTFVDWRYETGRPNFRMTATELDASVQDLIHELVRRLGLSFGCLDFIVDPDGELYFLEINPNGQFLFLEDFVPELRLLEAMTSMLATGSTRYDMLGIDGLDLGSFDKTPECKVLDTAEKRLDRKTSQVACADGLDTHIRTICPEAAAWKDQHENSSASQAVGRTEATATKPALRDELKSMADRDQKARDAWEKDGYAADSKAYAQVQKVDSANLARLRAVLSVHFPTFAEVGAEGVESSWLLLQHADTDPLLQERVLKSFDPAHVPEGISGKEYALLVDRVRINQKKPQVYGSQFHQVAGDWVPDTIEDPGNVDKRRGSLGLMPLRLYSCVISAMSTYKGH